MDIGNLFKGLGELITGLGSIKNGLNELGVDFGGFSSPAPAGETGQLKTYDVGEDIESRVKIIRAQILKGYKDPKIRIFASKVLSAKLATCPKCKTKNSYSMTENLVLNDTVRAKINEHDLWFCGKCGEEIPKNLIGWYTPEKDWQREVQTIYEVMRSNVRYLRDIFGVDTYQSPQRTLDTQSGDCDCITTAMGAMFMSVGYPIALRIMETKDPGTGRRAGTWNHIFLLVGVPPRDPKRWIPLDASLKAFPGWHPPKSITHKVRDFEVKP